MSEESRMKKTIIRIAVCVIVFLASALIIGSIMNQGHNNMTMEMAPATLPMITMESGGVACNELHGNTVEMDVAYQKDCITLLGEGRQANFTVDTFGREITGISTEVRSIDGSRLIENSEVTGWKANGKSFSVSLTLKDLIDMTTTSPMLDQKIAMRIQSISLRLPWYRMRCSRTTFYIIIQGYLR